MDNVRAILARMLNEGRITQAEHDALVSRLDDKQVARADVVAEQADALISQIAVGLAQNASDRDNLGSVTTVAAVRVALERILNREAAMMGALDRIVRYLRAAA